MVSVIAISQSYENNFQKKDNYFLHGVKSKVLLESILAIPENEIDISKIAYILAKDADPSLDLNVLYYDFENLINEIKEFTGPNDDPEHRVRALNTYLYKKMGIGYDKDDYQGKKLENRYIHTVLVKRTGACLNLAIFYIAVAQKLGYPVYAVAAPQHLFCRYVDPSFLRQNIEPTGSGAFSSDEDYILDMEIKRNAVENGSYLRTLNNKELVAEMVADHASFYYGQIIKNYNIATIILHKAVLLSPKTPENWSLLGQLYIKRSRHEFEPLIKESDYARGMHMIQKSKEMGINPPLADEYWKKPLPSKFRPRS
ncbi:MAG: hypothetical protein A2901_03530 [Elusimicrobia bacterium RIFCSPLOWO2_01_FULL_54_10]|nr:MAG: hypothetical protein A2901_03530 [Elusimicrobia bacterium RIFCSPLOWO2_01_FULL_54_10]